MKRALCLFATLPLLLILGCGGSGSGGASATSILSASTAPTTLSKADFIKQGDGICAEVNSAISSLSSSGTSSANNIGQEAQLYAGMVERLKALGTPSDSTGLDSVYTAASALVSAEQKAQLAAQRGDNTGLTSAQAEASTALASFKTAASSYGFQNCGQGTTSSVSSSGTSAGTSTSVTPVTPAAPTTTPAAPVTPAVPSGGTGGSGGGTAGSGGGISGGGSSGSSGGSSGSGGVGPG